MHFAIGFDLDTVFAIGFNVDVIPKANTEKITFSRLNAKIIDWFESDNFIKRAMQLSIVQYCIDSY